MQFHINLGDELPPYSQVVRQIRARYPSAVISILVGDGRNHVSRVHVDDLAAVVLAALDSDLTGAFPVADEEPCTSGDMARFCADLLGLPPPPEAGDIEVHHTLRANRRVNGRAVLKLLGVRLRYPSYRSGVPAAIEAAAKPAAET